MKKFVAKKASKALSGIASYFVFTASPFAGHRPEVPEELKK